jgi:hypothetical protein
MPHGSDMVRARNLSKLGHCVSHECNNPTIEIDFLGN